MENEILSQEKKAEIQQTLKDLNLCTSTRALIEDNKYLFSYKDATYRVRMPSQEDQIVAERIQNKEKIKLYKDKDNVTKKDWIKILKESQNIDIPALEKEKEQILSELRDAMLETALIPSDEPERLAKALEKQDEINTRFQNILIDIAEYLSPCIESQVKVEYYRYLAYMCTEEVVNDKTKKIWDSFEAYKKDESGLSTIALDGVQSLLLSLT